MVKMAPTLVPDGFIYLRATPQTCMSRLKSRSRDEETTVDISYLEDLHKRHDDWLYKIHANSVAGLRTEFDLVRYSATFQDTPRWQTAGLCSLALNVLMFAARRCREGSRQGQYIDRLSSLFCQLVFIVPQCCSVLSPLAAGLMSCLGGLQMLEIEGRRPELVPAERIKKAAQQSLTAPQVPEMITSEVSSDMQYID